MSQMAYVGVGETQVQNWLISQVFPIEKFCGHIQCVPIHFLEGKNYRIQIQALTYDYSSCNISAVNPKIIRGPGPTWGYHEKLSQS
jgi:hypothetical protein